MTFSPDSTRLPETLAERFADFHAKSPQVYSTLVALARQWVRATGRRRVGVKALFERARWELALNTSDPDFKLNNSYAPFYARLIMAQEPDLLGLFETRTSAADLYTFLAVPAQRRCPFCGHAVHGAYTACLPCDQLGKHCPAEMAR